MTDSGFLDDLTQVDLNTATPLHVGLFKTCQVSKNV